MTQLSRLFCFYIFTLFSFSMATIVKMEELHSERFMHTVILNGDLHVNDASQRDSLFDAIKKYKAYTILEAYKDEKTCPILLIDALKKELEAEQLPLFNAECRDGLARFILVFAHTLSLSYQEAQEFWQREDVKDIVLLSVQKMIHNGFALLQEIKQELVALKNKNSCSQEMLVTLGCELDDIGALYNHIYTEINAILLGQENDYMATRDTLTKCIFESAYTQTENGTTMHYRYKIDDNLFDMSNRLFDMRVVIHILKQQQEKTFFVVAGRIHTDNIATILRKIGYTSTTMAEDVEAITEIKDNQINSLDDVLKHEHNPKKLHFIQEFLDACKTLKKNIQD